MREKLCVVALVTLTSASATAHVAGTAEIFFYPDRGYTATVPVSAGRPNAAGYGLHILTEVRATRLRRFLVFEDALLLLGNARGGTDAKRNAQPTSMLGRYGVGFDVRRNIQLRLTHGEGYDFDRSKTVGDPWNSISLRFQQAPNRLESDDYLEVHLYPPHNEYDPYPSAAVPFAHRVVARYGLQFAKTVKIRLRRKFLLFTEPLLLLGNSRPQISYNYSAKPLAIRLVYGAGLAVRPSLQLRLTQGEWRNLGGYTGQSQFWNGISLRYRW